MKIKIVILLSVFLLLLEGCGMMGGHLFHGSHHNMRRRLDNKIIVKELQQDDYRIKMTLPAMVAGVENRIPILIRNAQAGQYVSGAAVTVFVQYVSDSLFVPANSAMEFDYEYRAVEIGTGNYEVVFIPDEPGTLALRAEIRLQGQEDEPITLDALQTVLPSEMEQDNKNNYTLLAVLGGIGMGVMMLFMLGWDMH